MKKIIKLEPLVAFILSITIFLILLWNNHIFGSGNYTILRGDLFSQYTAFIREFLDSFKGNNSFYYSFSNYFGSSNSLMIAYYAYNPFNFLYLIPGISLSLCTTLIICIKIGLSASCFVMLIQYIDKKRSIENNLTVAIINLISSLCYSLSGFIITFHYHIMWLDAFYMLPIICLCLHKFVFENKKTGLIISYIYLFITNFYMGYIVGMFSGLIFICLLIYKNGIKDIKRLLSKALSYAILVLLSIGSCMVLLLPAALQLINQTEESHQSFLTLKANFLDIINSMFIGHLPTINNEVPFLYCGIITILLLPIFFVNKDIKRKDKVLAAVVLGLLFLSMVVKPLYMLMHAFDKPNYYGFRFAFLAIFVMVIIGNITLKNIEGLKLWYFVPAPIFLISLYYFMIDDQKNRFLNIYFNDYSKFNINIVFIAVVSVLVCLLLKIKYKTVLACLILVSLLVELTINGNILFYQLGTSETEDKVNTYTTAIKEGLDQINHLEGNYDQTVYGYDYYRIRIDNDINFNTAGQFGFNSLTSFSSSDAPKLRELLKNLGIATGYHFILEKGYTEVTEMLFAAKYRMVLDYDNGNLAEVIENNNALPLTYMVDNHVYNYESIGNPFENQEYLISCITGKDYDIYLEIEDDVHFSSRGIFTGKKDGLENLLADSFSYNKISEIDFPTVFSKYKAYDGTSPLMTFYVPNKEGYVSYGYADVKDKEIIKGLPLFYGANQGKRNGNSVAYNDIVKGKNAGNAKNDIFNLSLNSKDSYEFKNIVFYYLDKEKVEELYNDINKNTVIISNFKSNYIKLKVNKEKDRSVMFTSIPYEKGWTGFVDGQEVEVKPCLEDTFISIDLSGFEDGEHNIELKFAPPGIKAGSVISIISILLTIFYISNSLKHRIYKGLQSIIH